MTEIARVYSAAVIGAGSGGRLSMQALAASCRFDLVAVADQSAEALENVQASYPGVKLFPNIAPCLRNVQPMWFVSQLGRRLIWRSRWTHCAYRSQASWWKSR